MSFAENWSLLKVGLDPGNVTFGSGSRQVTILPDAGHWVALTAPEALAMEIEALAGSQS